MTIKNISAFALEISPEQLTERFVRGDASRSTEGSGLGLSIAQGLAQLQGGRFKIEIDGDLFKAIVEIPLWKEI
jgi:signal transduction histidine kinase